MTIKNKKMNLLQLAQFISKKSKNNNQSNFFNISHTIGITITALGMAVMLIFLLMLNGMQKQISNKIYGLSGHIIMENIYDSDFQISLNTKLLKTLQTNIDKVYPYAYSMALVKSNLSTEGIFLKGYNLDDFKYPNIKQYIAEGRFLKKENILEIIISQTTALKLNLKIDNPILAFFIDKPPRYRKLKIVGIYKTNIPEIDESLALCNIKLLQQIKKWPNNKYQGYEIFLNKISQIPKVTQKLHNKFSDFNIYNIKNKFRGIFDWLLILQKNKNILFVLIIIIICCNIISIILVQMFDRIYTSGVLYTLGASNKLMVFIFLFNVLDIIIKGFLIGNTLGLFICFIQHFFKIITLDPNGVYLEYAHIDWNFINIIYLNITVFTILLFAAICFIFFVLKIKPVKAINFE